MNLFLRLLSTVILLPLVILLLILGHNFTEVFVFIIILFCLYEFGAMVLNNNKLGSFLFSLTGVFFIFFSTFLLIPNDLLVVFICFCVGVIFVFKPDWSKSKLEKVSMLLFGFFYIGYGLYTIIHLRKFVGNNGSQGVDFVFLVLIVTWSNDTFAYFIGKIFGKHKLYEKVSSKKTWEGFVGGGVAGVLMPFVLCFIFNVFKVNILISLKFYDIIAIGLLAFVAAPLGDLIESRLKRAYKIKDSGIILPGHGGMLDRVDSLLIISPVTLVYLVLFKI